MITSMRISVTAFAICSCLAIPARTQDWSYRVSSNLWSPSFNTSFEVGSQTSRNGTEGGHNILAGAFLVIGAAHRDEWTIVARFNALENGNDAAITLADPNTDAHLRGTMMSLAGSYAFYQNDVTRVEALAGMRHWDLDADTTPSNAPAGLDLNWTDPIIGVRVNAPAGAHTQFSGTANIGGFGIGSEHQLEVIARVEWPVSDMVSVSGGYRHLDIDLAQDTQVHMRMSGPFVALSLNF